MKYHPTKRQHVLPCASIKRFYYGEKNGVHLHLISQDIELFIHADDSNFVAKRKWDEAIEKASVAIETCFQKLVNSCRFEIDNVTDQQNRIINDFYALISERSKAKLHIFDAASPILEGSPIGSGCLDFFESQGIILGDADQIERAVRGLALRVSINASQRDNPKWGVIRAVELDFVVSDQYHQEPLIPVTPQIYLARGYESRSLSKNETIEFNRRLVQNSNAYFFARNLRNCGID